jgi:signal peptidase I
MRQAGRASGDTATALKCDLAGEVLRNFGQLRFPAVGWSMLPTVWPGDTLVVERISSDQVRVGDVVVVGRDGKLCGHRVISIAGDPESPQWITQGDALPVPDRPVRGSELLGRVAYLIRAGKRVTVPATLSVVELLIAKMVQRSVLAGRALVYLDRRVRTLGKSGQWESVLPCQG